MKETDDERAVFQSIVSLALVVIVVLLGVLVLSGCEATKGLINGLGRDINHIVR